jgi:hypothetical protein
MPSFKSAAELLAGCWIEKDLPQFDLPFDGGRGRNLISDSPRSDCGSLANKILSIDRIVLKQVRTKR